MIQRLVANLIQKRLQQPPAVGLVGPRQCGKTTLARSFPSTYFDLEVETERLRLDLQWASLVQGQNLVIQADQRVLVARVHETLESEGLLATDLPGLLKKLRAIKP